MDIKRTIKEQFSRTLSAAPINSELKLTLKNNPHSKAFVDKIFLQLNQVNLIREKQKKNPVTPKSVKDITHDLTLMFLSSVDNYFKNREASDLQKEMDRKKIEHQKDLELASNGTYKGDFEDLTEVLASEERSV